MIGLWSNYSSQFLTLIGWLIILVFIIPITLWPLLWAKVIGWKIPSDTDLVFYFGRCLGCVGGVVAYFSIIAAENPVLQPFYFKLLLSVWTTMVVLHIYGAIRRMQPVAETYEIGFWLLLLLLTLGFWPH